MKNFWKLSALVLVLVLASAAGCGDTTVDGPVPIEGTMTQIPGGPQVTYNKDTCNSNDDCKAVELCQADLAASKAVGYTIQVCVAGCGAELTTTTTKNEDGTSKVEVTKVPKTDTCQREGNTDAYCDLATHECKEYAYEEPEPVAPTPTEPEADLTWVMCCYSGDVAGLYGQLAWSTSTAADPEGWEAARDLEIDDHGCFDTQVDMDKVTIGFWVDLTQGSHDGKPADEVKWMGTSMKPVFCNLDGTLYSVGEFQTDFGWPFYEADE